jgi:hypothetical protein
MVGGPTYLEQFKTPESIRLLLATETDLEDVERLPIDEVRKELQRMGIDTQGLIESIENMVHQVAKKPQHDQGTQVDDVISHQDSSIFVDEHGHAARMEVIEAGGGGDDTANKRITTYHGAPPMAVMVRPYPDSMAAGAGGFRSSPPPRSVYVFTLYMGRTHSAMAPQGEADFVDPNMGSSSSKSNRASYGVNA